MNIKEKHIAIDGKSCRGSGTETQKMLHLLDVKLTDDCTFLGQEKNFEKSNEVTAIAVLLKTLDLENALVNIDAMGCQKDKTNRDKTHHISNQNNTSELFLKTTRNHWLIENKLHWSLEVIFKEDQSRKRNNNNVTENFSIILKTVLKLLQEKQLKNKRISIKRMRKGSAYNLD